MLPTIGDVVTYTRAKGEKGDAVVAAIVTRGSVGIKADNSGPDQRVNLTLLLDGGSIDHVADVPPQAEAEVDGAFYTGKQYV